MEVQIVPATPEHAAFVADHMREGDVREVAASSGLTPQQVMAIAIQVAECQTGLVDGEPIGIFGVSSRSMLSNAGTPWLLGTPALDRHRKALLRVSRNVVREWREHFEVLENYVDARNTKSVRWLRWLGFEIHAPEPHGVARMPFHKFTMKGV